MGWWNGGKQKEREPLKALIYFGLKKGQLTLPRYSLWVLAAAVILLTAWSIVSFSLATHLHFQNQARRERLRHLRTQLFNYQVDHEQIFEKTYENERLNVARKTPLQ